MGIAEALKAGPPKTTQANGLKMWLGTLPADERAAAIAMLEDARWTTKKVHKVFTDAGLYLSESHLHKLRAARAWV